MPSANGIPFCFALFIFRRNARTNNNNLLIHRRGPDIQHCPGCLPDAFPEVPFRAGYCDQTDGFGCATTESLFAASIFDGESLLDRQAAVHLCAFGTAPVDP